MSRTGRPPKPADQKLVRVAVSVRREDVDILKRLSLEVFSRHLAKANAAGEAHRMIFERGERPGVSAAIRYLIDAERLRRTVLAHGAWSNLPSGNRPILPPLEDLLAFDFVFAQGHPPVTTQEKAFAEAYVAALVEELRTNEAMVEGIEASAKRGADKLTQMMISLQSDRPKPKRKRR